MRSVALDPGGLLRVYFDRHSLAERHEAIRARGSADRRAPVVSEDARRCVEGAADGGVCCRASRG